MEDEAQADADLKQLERLYDYTKFHIGIYLSAAGGLATLITLAAQRKIDGEALFGTPWAVFVSFGLMVLASIAGAVVATSTIESTTYRSFFDDGARRLWDPSIYRPRMGDTGARLLLGKCDRARLRPFLGAGNQAANKRYSSGLLVPNTAHRVAVGIDS